MVWVIVLASCPVLFVLRFVVDLMWFLSCLIFIVFAAWLIFAIGSKDIVLNNRVVKYLSGISMEIYLCHMMFFRIANMLHLDKFIHNNDMMYVATCIATLIGAICFSHFIKYYVFRYLENSSKVIGKVRIR